METGAKADGTVTEHGSILTGTNTKEALSMIQGMDKACTRGATAMYTVESFTRISVRER